jgi:pantoate--beta-alanine ligase
MTMRVCSTITELRAVRAELGTLGLVPTMGSLHEGHLSLVRQAKAACDAVAVSIFVNPAQFGAAEDLARYPRNLARDLSLLEAEGVDLVFTPEPGEIYPPRFAFRVEVGALGDRLEGVERPGHFSAVATVVLKLFNIFQPSAAWFGQKDAQQCAVIRRMARDFDLPLRIAIGETIREADGLAMSSRNIRLNAAERQAAKVLFQALEAARRACAAGERDGDALRDTMRVAIATEPAARLSYASIADREKLRELDQVETEALALLAVQIGTIRLIDNARLRIPGAVSHY